MGTEAEVDVARQAGCVIVPVSTSSGDLPSRLLAESEIAQRLHSVSPTYLEAARHGTVTAQSLRDCITALLGP